jgi:hypothetical protein
MVKEKKKEKLDPGRNDLPPRLACRRRPTTRAEKGQEGRQPRTQSRITVKSITQ